MKSSFAIPARTRPPAFTLVEILVSLAVLTILLLINAQVIGQVQATWSASNARVSQFREARTAFDIITRNLSQATLNTYFDYDTNYLLTTAVSSAGSGVAPSSYVRRSDLHFVCGPAANLVTGTGGSGGGSAALPGHAVFFQAPLGISEQPSLVGLDRLLCARGYFVQYSSDEFFAPEFLPPRPPRFRYRLMEYSPPAEKNIIYSLPQPTGTNIYSKAWFADAGAAFNVNETALNQTATRPVADNILTLIISPRREPKTAGEAESPSGPTQIANSYVYDSSSLGVTSSSSPQGTRHLLPPLVRVVLVAIDERSAERLSEASGTSTSPPFGDNLNTPFTSAHNLDAEVQQLVTTLNEKKVNYRIFSSTIQLRGAKWSS